MMWVAYHTVNSSSMLRCCLSIKVPAARRRSYEALSLVHVCDCVGGPALTAAMSLGGRRSSMPLS